MNCKKVIIDNISDYASIAPVGCIKSRVTGCNNGVRVGVCINCSMQANPGLNPCVELTIQSSFNVIGQKIPHQQLGVSAC